MKDSFFEALREFDIELNISFYPPLEARKEDLLALLRKKEVRYVVTPLIREFTKKQTLHRHENGREVFLQCFQSHCNNLYDGKVAACFLPFTTKYFNRYFDKTLPEDGAVDLYEENMTTEKIKQMLATPLERCSYCTAPVPVEWGVIHHPSVLSDWVIEEE